MFYMQEKLVQSIDHDRHREAQAARSVGPSVSVRRRFTVPSTVVGALRTARAKLSNWLFVDATEEFVRPSPEGSKELLTNC